MPWDIPEIKICCGCIQDLKTAVAIIAVLAIVTSPAVSWSVVRHSYVIRVSCFVTTSANRADIVDINLNNILSFGFGANAGLGPSCLGPFVRNNNTDNFQLRDMPPNSEFVVGVKYVGWLVLLFDMIFVCTSIFFLYKLFKGSDLVASTYFMRAACLSIFSSFVYGMLYIYACVSIGGSFPIFEFLFSIIDVLIWLMWIHFIQVLCTYIRIQKRLAVAVTAARLNEYSISNQTYNLFFRWMDYMRQIVSYFRPQRMSRLSIQPASQERVNCPASPLTTKQDNGQRSQRVLRISIQHPSIERDNFPASPLTIRSQRVPRLSIQPPSQETVKMQRFSILPVVNACMCCISIRTGCLFIALLCLGYSLWHIYFLVKLNHNKSKLKGFLTFLNYLAMIFDIILFCYSLVFIYAIVKENAKKIRTFMIILLTYAIFLFIFTFFACPGFYEVDFLKIKNADWPRTIIFNGLVILCFYFLVVINSYYLTLRDINVMKEKPCAV